MMMTMRRTGWSPPATAAIRSPNEWATPARKRAGAEDKNRADGDDGRVAEAEKGVFGADLAGENDSQQDEQRDHLRPQTLGDEEQHGNQQDSQYDGNVGSHG